MRIILPTLSYVKKDVNNYVGSICQLIVQLLKYKLKNKPIM